MTSSSSHHQYKKGYFLYDTLECILRFEHEGPEFLAHGVFCLAVFGALVHIRCVHWFGAGFLMWEISTPFVHFRCARACACVRFLKGWRAGVAKGWRAGGRRC